MPELSHLGELSLYTVLVTEYHKSLFPLRISVIAGLGNETENSYERVY